MKIPVIPTVNVPSPPTGDTGKSPLGLIMVIAGLVGIFYVSAKSRKRKAEKDFAALCPEYVERDDIDE